MKWFFLLFLLPLFFLTPACTSSSSQARDDEGFPPWQQEYSGAYVDPQFQDDETGHASEDDYGGNLGGER